jgi:hypothetical protein
MSCFVVMSGIAGSTSKSSRRFRSRRSMNFANAIQAENEQAQHHEYDHTIRRRREVCWQPRYQKHISEAVIRSVE